MNRGKLVLLILLVIFTNLLFFDIGVTQTKRVDETIFLSGPVKDVSWDDQSIVVKGKKFFISNDTMVVDQKGNRLKIGDVKTNSDVAIDAVIHPRGFLIKKIVVIQDRGV